MELHFLTQIKFLSEISKYLYIHSRGEIENSI